MYQIALQQSISVGVKERPIVATLPAQITPVKNEFKPGGDFVKIVQPDVIYGTSGGSLYPSSKSPEGTLFKITPQNIASRRPKFQTDVGAGEDANPLGDVDDNGEDNNPSPN